MEIDVETKKSLTICLVQGQIGNDPQIDEL